MPQAWQLLQAARLTRIIQSLQDVRTLPQQLKFLARTPVVPAARARAIHPGGGILRPVVLEGGVAVGTWTAPGGTVKLDLWQRVTDAGALDAEIAAVSASCAFS